MDWQNERDMLERLATLQKSTPPRKEFVESLRTVLEQETSRVGKKGRLFMNPLTAGMTAVVIAVGFGLYIMAGMGQNELMDPEVTATSSPQLPAHPVYEQAKKLLQELAGREASEYAVNGMLSNTDTGVVVMNKTVNNIPVLEDQYTFTIDQAGRNHKKEVRTNDTTGMVFPDPKKAMPVKQAEQIFGQSARLLYSEWEGRLLYEFPFSGDIDAITGEIYPTERYHPDYSLVDMPPIPVKPGGIKLVAPDIEEADRLFREWGFEPPFSFVIQEGSDVVHTYKIETRTKQKIELTVVTDTGKILNYRYENIHGKKEKLPHPKLENVQEAAKQFQKYLPLDTKELLLGSADRKGNIETYQFFKSHQGVPIMGGYTVHFDVDRKQVIGVDPTYTMESKQFPDKSKAMSREDATNVYVTHRPLRLVYKLMENPTTGKLEPRLVYHIYYHDTPLYMVDALTGEWVRS
ncbi:hypothetical protein FB479_102622 [Brevibacillus sp. AG162]|uniref:hypothetical protein n=1 Tax=Brevibacillus sp. AG162 TaxID=2572910 RepID=UPI0011544A2F|nr:hypothetical protein [Brevibacillus sp. AG162]TQK73982.1 hypothetical protein FB479_102622 [Brevibacillus sp. AG162]